MAMIFKEIIAGFFYYLCNGWMSSESPRTVNVNNKQHDHLHKVMFAYARYS